MTSILFMADTNRDQLVLGSPSKKASTTRTDIEANGKGDIEFSAFDLIDSRDDPYQSFRTTQIESQLKSSLNMLPVSLREMARLKFLEERSVEEIPTTLCLSGSATQSRLYRARKLISSMDSELIRTPC